ncbi:MAG TPA: flagellar hook protein FlgE [Rhodanobacteraceae bacterium]|nr:flagellar hook protein FlgE [Oleiagrimonas sp.]HET9819546.1 flagellar hook protein FlgE [Rhodanobacteraceae bacterium]
MPFNIALSGLNAASSDLEVTANNIANTNTAGFKGSRADFADVFSTTGANLSNTAIGSGVRLTGVTQQFGNGNIEYTQNTLDMAISGNGFFTVKGDDGIAYTRAGNFQQDKDGYVVTPDGRRLQVFPPNGAGGFDISTMNDLQLVTSQSQAKATGNVLIAFNLPAGATVPTSSPFDPADPTSFNQATPFTIYDSQGGEHNATAYYVKTATPNEWQVNLMVDGQNAGTATMAFSSNGSLATPANGKLSFNPVTVSPGTDPIQLTMDMSQATQFGTNFSAGAVNQDGFPAGKLSNIDVSADGVVSANFSNGQSKPLGQLALADFADRQGLRQLGDTSWAESYESGQAVRGSAGSGKFGTIQSGALEASNTSDLTAQLVNMIKAQRNYQANAQVISTDDKMVQTVINIRN